MKQLRWTEGAVEDLASVKRFIERDSPHHARLVIEGLLDRVERIPFFRLAGRAVPELGRNDIRELIYGSYRIVYWIEGDAQHILTIFQSSRVFQIRAEDLP